MNKKGCDSFDLKGQYVFCVQYRVPQNSETNCMPGGSSCKQKVFYSIS